MPHFSHSGSPGRNLCWRSALCSSAATSLLRSKTVTKEVLEVAGIATFDKEDDIFRIEKILRKRKRGSKTDDVQCEIFKEPRFWLIVWLIVGWESRQSHFGAILVKKAITARRALLEKCVENFTVGPAHLEICPKSRRRGSIQGHTRMSTGLK